MIQENLSVAVTIEGLAKKISAWHAQETALRHKLDSMPEDSPGRDRIESDADGFAERIIRAEDQISYMPATNSREAFLKLLILSWRAELDEPEDRALVRRLLQDATHFLETESGTTAEALALGDWLDR
jgi:hypothetical protein